MQRTLIRLNYAFILYAVISHTNCLWFPSCRKLSCCGNSRAVSQRELVQIQRPWVRFRCCFFSPPAYIQYLDVLSSPVVPWIENRDQTAQCIYFTFEWKSLTSLKCWRAFDILCDKLSIKFRSAKLARSILGRELEVTSPTVVLIESAVNCQRGAWTSCHNMILTLFWCIINIYVTLDRPTGVLVRMVSAQTNNTRILISVRRAGWTASCIFLSKARIPTWRCAKIGLTKYLPEFRTFPLNIVSTVFSEANLVKFYNFVLLWKWIKCRNDVEQAI